MKKEKTPDLDLVAEFIRNNLTELDEIMLRMSTHYENMNGSVDESALENVAVLTKGKKYKEVADICMSANAATLEKLWCSWEKNTDVMLALHSRYPHVLVRLVSAFRRLDEKPTTPRELFTGELRSLDHRIKSGLTPEFAGEVYDALSEIYVKKT